MCAAGDRRLISSVAKLLTVSEDFPLSFLHFLHASNFMVVPRFAIVLGIMVVVHELGHFVVAKLCGVRVEAFAIGFGKRLFGVVHNGTDYCVNLVPLGGYVKMAGVGDEPVSGSEQSRPQVRATLDPGELQNHPRWQRALIAVAGPVANFILAFALLAGAYMFDNQVPAFFRQPATANYVSPNSQMAKTGIQPGDTIVYLRQPGKPDVGRHTGARAGEFQPGYSVWVCAQRPARDD